MTNTNDEVSYGIPWKSALIFNFIALSSAIATVVLSYAGAFPFNLPDGVYRILPGDILFDFVWLYVISILVGIIIYFVTPYFSILFWKMHQLINHNSYRYHLQSIDSRYQMKGYRSLIVPSLVSMGLAMSLASSSLKNVIFVTESFNGLDPGNEAMIVSMPILFITLLVSSVILFLFAPIWLLENSGVICEKKVDSTLSNVEIEGVGNFYHKLLKGFAGISTIITYLLLSIQSVGWFQWMATVSPPEGFPIFLYVIPVIIVFLSPILAMGPISAVNLFYAVSLRRNILKVTNQLTNEGLTSIKVEIISE